VAAKTVEEAIELALKQLGVERDEVDVVVVAEGKSGILGIGSEPARVRVTPREQVAKPAVIAKEILERLIEHMGVSATVNLEDGGPEDGEADIPFSLDISGEDSGLLIGRGGITLSALQHVVNFMVSRRLETWVSVSVDVEGYRKRRHQALKDLAMRLADRVKRSGRPFILEPMPPAERRVIHLALAHNDHVTTESTGQGEGRRVRIHPKSRW
ncbi:MAG: RNA-binding cell elongation regulator Jag/EloR, partial [Dehalococcoidia bacterium]